MVDDRPIGAALNRDIATGEKVEAKIDAMISRRHDKRVLDEGERDEEAERLRQDLGAMTGLREVLSGEKDAKMFNVYPPEHMVWNYERADTDATIQSEGDRGLLERLGG